MPSRGSPPLQSGGKIRSGPSPPIKAGGKRKWLHKWARWLHHPCRLGDPHRFKAGGKIRSGPQVGKVATSPLPPRGSPPLQSGGQNQKWPINGQGGYITAAAWGSPRLQSGGQNQKWPINGATSPLPRGDPPSKRGAKSEVAHKWARWLHRSCRLGDPHRFKAGGKIRSGPQVGKVATSPLPPRGPPPLQSGGQNQKWPIHARWLHHPCHLGDPHRFKARGKIRSGPYMGKVAT